jgi:hypothetical protein
VKRFDNWTYGKCKILILALLLCATIARAQYNQVNNIPYRDAAKGYAQERCMLVTEAMALLRTSTIFCNPSSLSCNSIHLSRKIAKKSDSINDHSV